MIKTISHLGLSLQDRIMLVTFLHVATNGERTQISLESSAEFNEQIMQKIQLSKKVRLYHSGITQIDFCLNESSTAPEGDFALSDMSMFGRPIEFCKKPCTMQVWRKQEGVQLPVSYDAPLEEIRAIYDAIMAGQQDPLILDCVDKHCLNSEFKPKTLWCVATQRNTETGETRKVRINVPIPPGVSEKEMEELMESKFGNK